MTFAALCEFLIIPLRCPSKRDKNNISFSSRLMYNTQLLYTTDDIQNKRNTSVITPEIKKIINHVRALTSEISELIVRFNSYTSTLLLIINLFIFWLLQIIKIKFDGVRIRTKSNSIRFHSIDYYYMPTHISLTQYDNW